MKAIWNKQVIAESSKTIEIEGNQYFPLDSVNIKFLKKTESKSTCPWKGEASYYDVVVDGDMNEDAAWTYIEPKEKAKQITKYIAFWKGIQIE